MSKKTPSQEELASKVFVGNFGDDQQPGILEYQDGDKLILHPDQISAYDRNPRRIRNREYENIRDQLLVKGVQEVMSVTRRPDMPLNQFMTARGFNTRLKIIKELYEQTGDERFNQLECRYVAWQSEAATYTSHMAENEIRGEVLFYDRAASVMELQGILEEESGSPVGHAKLIKYLKQQGIQKITRPDIARFEYTIRHLEKGMPQVLEFGLGPRQVDAISNLHDIAARLWKQAGEDDDWDPLFQGILQKLDKRLERLEDWSQNKLIREVARELGGNDTREIELALAKIDFVMETGELPEMREFTEPFIAPPKPTSRPHKQKTRLDTDDSQDKSISQPTPVTKDQAPTQAIADDSDQSIIDDLGFELEDTEEDPNDALIDIHDPLFAGLLPDPDISPEEQAEIEAQLLGNQDPLIERDNGLMRVNPVDHEPFKWKSTDETEEEFITRIKRWVEEHPSKPLTPEQEELFQKSQAFEAELERNRSEAGRGRGTTMRIRRLLENLKDIPLESLQHHGYASALRISRAYPALDDLVQPLNNGVGFYLSDTPQIEEYGDDLNRNETLMIQTLPWWWLLTVSGQLNIHDVRELPQDILNSPLWKLMATAENNDGFYHFPGLMNVLTQRYPMPPLIPILHETFAMTSLNLSVDQAILMRVLTESKRRCLAQPDARQDGYQSLFNLESRWDKEYVDEWIDQNDAM
ncbi:MAG: hypothetical protein KZQ96_22635 [Candidatus Thiodiazotropha sp. (ex Lucinoma borealis)]|nr:hypothetical protein [Candidatus Thiodiazotropha sp. (ex Lucinoma borealis)]